MPKMGPCFSKAHTYTRARRLSPPLAASPSLPALAPYIPGVALRMEFLIAPHHIS